MQDDYLESQDTSKKVKILKIKGLDKEQRVKNQGKLEFQPSYSWSTVTPWVKCFAWNYLLQMVVVILHCNSDFPILSYSIYQRISKSSW